MIHSKSTLQKSKSGSLGISLTNCISVARVVIVQTHAEFLNLSLSEFGKEEDTLSEEEMYRCMVTYLNYAIIDSDVTESWNLRREAHEAFAKLKKTTESAVRKHGRIGGLVGNFFAPAAAPKGSLKEVGEKLTQDLLAAGYSVEKTATTLLTTASGGIANLPSIVSRSPIFCYCKIWWKLTSLQSLCQFSTGFLKQKTHSTGQQSESLPRMIVRPHSRP